MSEVQNKRLELEKLHTLKQLRTLDEKYGLKPSIEETTEWSILMPVDFPEGTTTMVYYDKMPDPGWCEEIKTIGFMKVLNLMGTKFRGLTPIVIIQMVSSYNTFAKFSKEVTKETLLA